MDSDPRMTRAGLAKWLTDQGYPTTITSLNTWTSRGEGPPIDGWWGQRAMYQKGPCLEWAKSRFRPAPKRNDKAERSGAHA
jgi:hypothetical protein